MFLTIIKGSKKHPVNVWNGRDPEPDVHGNILCDHTGAAERKRGGRCSSQLMVMNSWVSCEKEEITRVTPTLGNDPFSVD